MPTKNAFNVEPPKLLTVKSLREYLDEMERLWTEEDRMYMGEFEDHQINIIYYKDGQPQGIGMGYIYYHGGLDFVIRENEYFTRLMDEASRIRKES